MKRTAITSLLTASVLLVLLLASAGSPAAQQVGKDTENILSLRERAELTQKWWEWRRENVIPEIMREQGIDMWIVRDDEGELFFNNESPVYVSLLPANYEGMTLASQHVRPGSQRTPWFMVFYDNGSEIEYIEPHTYDDISALFSGRDPQVIAIADFANDRMLAALGEKYAARTVSSWTIGVRWLETMTPEQISVYRHVQGVANEIIAEGFSNSVITPDVTTTDDLNWWFRHRMLELGMEYENHPSIVVQRRPELIAKYDDPPEYFRNGRTSNGMNVTIRRGDVVSCDTDIMLLGLTTDSHQHAYVLLEGESDVPDAMKEGLRKVNRIQDLFAKEFILGRTGKEIVEAAEAIVPEEGIIETELGFHPPPTFIRRYLVGGFMFPTKPYVAGMTSGEGYYPTSIVGNHHKLFVDTLYAFEPHTRVAVPGWGPSGIELGIGQIAIMTPDGLRYLDRPQESEWHVVK
jgi:hypothetical protein